MEALAALSVAASVVQFVDYGSRAVVAVKRLYREGSTEEIAKLLALTAELRRISDGISQQTTGDIESLRQKCVQSCDQLRQLLQSIIPKRERHFVDAISSGWRNLRAKKKIEKLEEEIDSYRRLLDTGLLASLRQTVASLDDDLRSKIATRDDIQFLVRSLDQNRVTVEAIIRAEGESVRTHVTEQFAAAAALKIAERRYDAFVESLQYELMFVRHQDIEDAHRETFRWLFSPDPRSECFARESALQQWLISDEPLFWLEGKPGSGKSTLMRTISEEQQTLDFLKRLTGKDVVLLTHFFWKPGVRLQKNLEGLLRSLLYQLAKILGPGFKTISEIQGENSGSNGLYWTNRTLKECLRRVIDSLEKPLYLFVDGLDEFEGNGSDLLDYLIELSCHGNVKCLLSSRPELIFESRLGSYPGMHLQDLTKIDLQIYVNDRLKDHFEDPDTTDKLCKRVLDRADGIFLWVRLVVDDLLERILSADTESELMQRVEASEPGLENLYLQMLQRIKSDYREYAGLLFYLTMLFWATSFGGMGGFLTIMFAIEEEASSGLHEIDERIFAKRCDQFIRKIKARSWHLLEYRVRGKLPRRFEDSDGDTSCIGNPVRGYDRSEIRFMHRTVQDFILSSDAVKALIPMPQKNDAIGKLLAGRTQHIIASKNSNTYSHFYYDLTTTFFTLLSYQSDSASKLDTLQQFDRGQYFIRHESTVYADFKELYHEVDAERRSAGLVSIGVLSCFIGPGKGRLTKDQLLGSRNQVAQFELDFLMAEFCNDLFTCFAEDYVHQIRAIYPNVEGLKLQAANISLLLTLGAKPDFEYEDKRFTSRNSIWSNLLNKLLNCAEVDRESKYKTAPKPRLLSPPLERDVIFEVICRMIPHLDDRNQPIIWLYNDVQGMLDHELKLTVHANPLWCLQICFEGSERLQELSRYWNETDPTFYWEFVLSLSSLDHADDEISESDAPSQQVRIPGDDCRDIVGRMVEDWGFFRREVWEIDWDIVVQVWTDYGGSPDVLERVEKSSGNVHGELMKMLKNFEWMAKCPTKPWQQRQSQI